ncbi:hypothetical protein K501DRAFT_253698 [Backusella circina FSU 941]|nr:hypothetical protein K501DRAFT_253698 [Backusella circina FSU 941]
MSVFENSSTASSSSSSSSTLNLRLEHFRTQHELARNFYDDYEFCPLRSIEEATEHRDRIQQRTSPYQSPNHSPPTKYTTVKAPQQTRAIPIINPTNMTPVSVPQSSAYYSSRQSSPPPPMNSWAAHVKTSYNACHDVSDIMPFTRTTARPVLQQTIPPGFYNIAVR